MASTIKAPATSVVDTVLGEAASGTKAQRYADMLGVASVIANRATLTSTTPEDIVSALGQFDAYGKALPKGAEAYRSLAEKAVKQVNTIGPVTNATYYATPSAYNDLPSGLDVVERTTGHIYAVDPQNRPFVTKQGVVSPAAEAVAHVAERVNQGVQGAFKSLGNTIGEITERVGRGLGTHLSLEARQAIGDKIATAHGLQPGQVTLDNFNQRRDLPSTDIVGKVAESANRTIPGARTSLYSGQEPGGVPPAGAPHRHPSGFAGDFDFYNPAGGLITDKVALQDIAMDMAARHKANIGIGPEYMGPARMHIDTMPLGQYPGGAQWKSTALEFNKPQLGTGIGNLDFARQTGIGPTPYTNAPTPFSRSQPNPNSLAPSEEDRTNQVDGYGQAARSMAEAGVRSIGGWQGGQTYAAPVGQVTRSPLGGVFDSPVEGPTDMGRNAWSPPSAPASTPHELFSNDARTAAAVARATDTPEDPRAQAYGSMKPSPARPSLNADPLSSAPKRSLGPDQSMAPSVMGAAYGHWAAPMAAETMNNMMTGQNVPVSPAPTAPAPSTADLAKAYSTAAYQRAMPAPTPEAIATASWGTPPAPVEAAPQKTIEAPVDVQAAPKKQSQTITAAPKLTQEQQTNQVRAGKVKSALVKAAPKIAGSVIGSALLGPLGGIAGNVLGGMIGPKIGGALRGVFGDTPNPTRSTYGTGVRAMSDILGGGGVAGSTAYSRSMPGYSVTNLGNGMVEKTNQYGVKSYEHTGFTSSLFGGKSGGGGFSGFGSGKNASKSEAGKFSGKAGLY